MDRVVREALGGVRRIEHQLKETSPANAIYWGTIAGTVFAKYLLGSITRDECVARLKEIEKLARGRSEE